MGWFGRKSAGPVRAYAPDWLRGDDGGAGFKTSDGAYIWQAGLVSGSASTLLGYPVIEAEDMPDVAANSLSIAFGNFKAGYTIAERNATQILRDPFTNKPFVHFYATTLADLLIGGSLVGGPIGGPPASPVLGWLYLVAPSGTSGAFVGKEGQLAGWTAAGWRFVVPAEGMRLTMRSAGIGFDFHDGAWRSGSLRADELVIDGVRVVGNAKPAIADPAGGATIDANVRASVAQILAALRGHGLIQT